MRECADGTNSDDDGGTCLGHLWKDREKPAGRRQPSGHHPEPNEETVEVVGSEGISTSDGWRHEWPTAHP